jgi:hypothetical protein
VKVAVDKTDWIADKWSYSKAACFSKCPRKCFYKYVTKKKESVSAALLFGRGAHDGQETDAYAKLRGELLPIKQVLEAAVAGFEHEKKETGLLHASTDEFVAEHKKQLEIYESTGERAKIVPVPGTVEAMFQIDIDVGGGDAPKVAATVEGFTDVVSQNPETGVRTAVDYKTAGRPVSDVEAENHLQLMLEAVGAGAGSAKIVTFVKHQKQKPTCKVTGEVPVTEERWQKVLAWLADTIHGFRRCLKSGDFPKCSPECFWCGPQWCDFYQLCYPTHLEDLGNWIEVKEIRPAGTLPVQEWRESLAGKQQRERSQK